jgi:hypothetical protein
MNMQRAVHDSGALPNAIHQLVFGNKFTGRLGENFDDVEGACANRHGRTKDPKFTTNKVDLAFA